MKETLGDILVVSDMDGTLLNPDLTITPGNLETIKLFTALGGRFTVATGRTPASVKLYPELAEVLAPGITCGGCVIYDFARQAAAKSTTLPHLAARQGLNQLSAAFPGLGAMVMGDDLHIYVTQLSQELQQLINDEKMVYFSRPEDCLPEQWNKILFAGPPDVLEQVKVFVAEHAYPGTYFVATNRYYYEMMPKGVSKGTALADLCKLLDVPMSHTYVIGDYYNDIEIMKYGGYAVAVDNAPDDVKAVADEIIDTGPNGGVGQFLYRLIQKYG